MPAITSDISVSGCVKTMTVRSVWLCFVEHLSGLQSQRAKPLGVPGGTWMRVSSQMSVF